MCIIVVVIFAQVTYKITHPVSWKMLIASQLTNNLQCCAAQIDDFLLLAADSAESRVKERMAPIYG